MKKKKIEIVKMGLPKDLKEKLEEQYGHTFAEIDADLSLAEKIGKERVKEKKELMKPLEGYNLNPYRANVTSEGVDAQDADRKNMQMLGINEDDYM